MSLSTATTTESLLGPTDDQSRFEFWKKHIVSFQRTMLDLFFQNACSIEQPFYVEQLLALWQYEMFRRNLIHHRLLGAEQEAQFKRDYSRTFRHVHKTVMQLFEEDVCWWRLVSDASHVVQQVMVVAALEMNHFNCAEQMRYYEFLYFGTSLESGAATTTIDFGEDA